MIDNYSKTTAALFSGLDDVVDMTPVDIS